MPKISVIVPVYKTERYLNRCVDSILDQTFKDFELILVDDGSPDNCPVICDNFAAKYDFIHVIHKTNGGQAEARNQALDWVFVNSNSEYITFIDSDDWVHNRYLEILYNICMDNKVLISCCKYDIVQKFSENSVSTNKINVEAHIDNADNLINHIDITIPWARLYKKILWKDIRFPIGKVHEDEFVTPFILYACSKIGFTNVSLYYYYQNQTSTTHLPKTPKAVDNQLEGILKQLDYFSNTKFERTFNVRLKGFKMLATTYFIDYGREKAYRKILRHRITEARKIIKKNRQKITCYDANRYDFNKWIIGVTEQMNVFREDVQTVKEQKGKLYAFFWSIFNYIKIKLLMRI